jgi:hypothetical protein
MDSRDWATASRGGLIEYAAEWRPDNSVDEPVPTRFIGRYGCPLVVDGELRGHYIVPLLVEAGAPFVSGGAWLSFSHPPAPRKYFQYPQLLECWAGAGGNRVAAGLTATARPVQELPEAIGSYATVHNSQWP